MEGGRELYRVGDLLLDVEARLLTQGGVVVPLPPKTFELLAELVRRAPGVVRRQELIDTVWPKEFVNDEALTQRVLLLRRTLGDDAKEPTYIASVPRWGYRIIAAVERVGTETLPAPDNDGIRPDARSTGRLRNAATLLRRRDRRVAWVGGAILAAGVVAGVLLILSGMENGPIESLAVVPFSGSGINDDSGILCSGIPASVTATMAQAHGLRVIAASTMARYTGTFVDPQRVGRELGVRAVLTGSLTRRDDVLVIETELVDVRDGSRLWGARIERRISDILTVQQEISREIATGLRLRLSCEAQRRLGRLSTQSPRAYILYLEGRHHWNKRSAEGFQHASASFRRAIDVDPDYALAYVGIADCLALQGSMEYGVAPPTDVMPRARGAVIRALEIDPDLAEAHASLGLVLWRYDWNRAGAERELRRAIELSPAYATAHQWLAEMLAEQGRADEADLEIRLAQEFDPLSLVIAADRGLLAYYKRDHESAVSHFQSTLALDPTFVQARMGLGLAFLEMGKYQDAIGALEEADRLAGSAPPTLSVLGYALGRTGRTSEAQVLLRTLVDLSRRQYVSSMYSAGILIGIGDRDGAFGLLQRACDERTGLLGALAVWPVFDPLRPDPRFPELLRCVGLDPPSLREPRPQRKGEPRRAARPSVIRLALAPQQTTSPRRCRIEQGDTRRPSRRPESSSSDRPARACASRTARP